MKGLFLKNKKGIKKSDQIKNKQTNIQKHQS